MKFKFKLKIHNLLYFTKLIFILSFRISIPITNLEYHTIPIKQIDILCISHEISLEHPKIFLRDRNIPSM